MKAVPFEELWGEQAQNLSRGGGVKINVSGEESFFGVFSCIVQCKSRWGKGVSEKNVS